MGYPAFRSAHGGVHEVELPKVTSSADFPRYQPINTVVRIVAMKYTAQLDLNGLLDMPSTCPLCDSPSVVASGAQTTAFQCTQCGARWRPSFGKAMILDQRTEVDTESDEGVACA